MIRVEGCLRGSHARLQRRRGPHSYTGPSGGVRPLLFRVGFLCSPHIWREGRPVSEKHLWGSRSWACVKANA